MKNSRRAQMRSTLGFIAVAAAFVACSDATDDGIETSDDALNNGTPVVGFVGKCLDDPGDSTASSTVVQLYTCNGTDAQKWLYTKGTFVGPGGKCLDVRSSGTALGTPVQLYTCNGTSAQQWKIVGKTIVGIGGQCLDVTGQNPANRTPIQMWTCNGQANQEWNVGSAPVADAGTKDSGSPKPDSGVKDSGSGGGGGSTGGGGALSGLAWQSGAGSDDINAFASWRGRPLDFGVTWPNRGNWNELRNPDIYGAISGFSGFAGKIAVGIAMVPEDNSASFSQCATGAYDQYYKDVGSKLASLGRGNSVVRLGWEANGNWYAWSINDDVANYVACFRKEAAAIRSTAPGIAIDWNMNKDSKLSVSVANAYPGDDVVDIVGVDFYDNWPSHPNEGAWDSDYNATKNGGPFGLGTWLAFAEAHHKKLSVPEWGINNDPAGASQCGCGGDDPFYVTKMHDFFSANAANIAYEEYFNLTISNGNTQFEVFPASANPQAAAAYRAGF